MTQGETSEGIIALKEDLESEGARRRQDAAERPDDERYLKAADLLDSLVASVDKLHYRELLFFEPLRTTNEDGWQEMLGEVGFSRFPNNARTLVNSFVFKYLFRRRVK